MQTKIKQLESNKIFTFFAGLKRPIHLTFFEKILYGNFLSTISKAAGYRQPNKVYSIFNILFVSTLFLPFVLEAQDSPKQLHAKFIENNIKIDGILDDSF